MSMMLVDDLVDELELTVGTPRETAHEALVHLRHRGCLKEPGTEVDESELQVGDRFRLEYDYRSHDRYSYRITGDGEPKPMEIVRRYTVEQIRGTGTPWPLAYSGDSVQNVRYFLLERAEPELPSTWGTVAAFRPRTDPGPEVQAVYGRDGKWRGIDLCLDAELMAQRYRLIEVLS